METVMIMGTGLKDKNGKEIKVGDQTRLELPDGSVRVFDVKEKTVVREVVSHPDFDVPTAKVSITGIVFEWNGYDLFPCIDDNGVPDNEKMEVIEKNKVVVTRKLVYDFFNLPSVRQYSILNDLGLILDGEKDLEYSEAFPTIVHRANESGRGELLVEKIKEYYIKKDADGR